MDEPQRISISREVSLYLSISSCSVEARLLDALATYGYSSIASTMRSCNDNRNTMSSAA